MSMQAPGSVQLPDYIGFGWLDSTSVRTDERSVQADYVNGEDLIYRVRLDEAGTWSITEYLDLGPVRTAAGRSLSAAVGSLVGRSASMTEPVVWARLRRHLPDRVDVTAVEQPAMVDMWGLYTYNILALYNGNGRPPAPDFRPKSYHVRRGRPPRPSGDLIYFFSHGVVRDAAATASEMPCVCVSYRTPAINVLPVVEALLENSYFPAPWRIVVHAGDPSARVWACSGNRGRRAYTLESVSRTTHEPQPSRPPALPGKSG